MIRFCLALALSCTIVSGATAFECDLSERALLNDMFNHVVEPYGDAGKIPPDNPFTDKTYEVVAISQKAVAVAFAEERKRMGASPYVKACFEALWAKAKLRSPFLNDEGKAEPLLSLGLTGALQAELRALNPDFKVDHSNSRIFAVLASGSWNVIRAELSIKTEAGPCISTGLDPQGISVDIARDGKLTLKAPEQSSDFTWAYEEASGGIEVTNADGEAYGLSVSNFSFDTVTLGDSAREGCEAFKAVLKRISRKP